MSSCGDKGARTPNHSLSQTRIENFYIQADFLVNHPYYYHACYI
jgi:hypothetical protein